LLGYAGKLGTSDLTGGTFSLSNIGAVSYVWNTTVGTDWSNYVETLKYVTDAFTTNLPSCDTQQYSWHFLGIFLCEKILFHMGYLPLKHISCLKGFIMFDLFLIRVPTVVFHT
jgi:hypothetical protein